MTIDSVPELARRILHLEMEMKRSKPSVGSDNAALLKRVSALESSVSRLGSTTPIKPQVYTPKPAVTIHKPADNSLALKVSALEREVERLKVKERPDSGSGVTDHGALTGLSDNDHPQYLLTTGKAADSDKLDNIDSSGFVQTSGNQTVGGIKTFSSIPVLPATNPTTANQAVRKGYADATYLGKTAKAADSDKLDGKTLAQVMLSIYPVGAIFMSSASTNPGTLFGGTWEAYGQGRVLVGKAASGTFATAGATGGSETHTLTVAQMPSHTHIQDAHAHTIPSSESGSDFATTRPGGYGNTLTTSSTTATNQNTGGGEAHNNLQPYIVVYMWRRTG